MLISLQALEALNKLITQLKQKYEQMKVTWDDKINALVPKELELKVSYYFSKIDI